MKNFWTDHASALADEYARSAGPVQFELVTRSLLLHMPEQPQRVVDVGGGFGRQAIMLARKGHSVVVVDFDPNMLDLARQELSRESDDVCARVNLVPGDGVSATELVGSGFDLACCHSVLMYQKDPVPMLAGLVDLVRRGGLVSVLSLNTDAIAMRSGLQGRWREAAASLKAGRLLDSQYVPSGEHSRERVTEILNAAGARAIEWYGVGVFTDHLREKLVVEDPAQVYLAEWLAGERDPYRQVARCFHLLARRF